VRIAPNDLLFWTPEAYNGEYHVACEFQILIFIQDIYAHSGKSTHWFRKTRFQDIGEKELGITAERDPEKHKIVRKMLNPGFSARASKNREDVVHYHTDLFISQLKAQGGTERGIDISEVSVRHLLYRTQLIGSTVELLVGLGYRRRYGIWTQIRLREEL